MATTEEEYHDFMKQRLADFGIRDDKLVAKISAAMVELHRPQLEVCPCGKPVVFTEFKREFECTRCNKKWKLVMEIEPIS
ncbi:hypothetical protein KJ969_03115 [Patescibacteria group bacterium]|nr:hypothetical protein [Patescibacteria group bacterium]MBU1922147.1 hypothetical protein [Patescibacteria group bacterium]